MQLISTNEDDARLLRSSFVQQQKAKMPAAAATQALRLFYKTLCAIAKRTYFKKYLMKMNRKRILKTIFVLVGLLLLTIVLYYSWFFYDDYVAMVKLYNSPQNTFKNKEYLITKQVKLNAGFQRAISLLPMEVELYGIDLGKQMNVMNLVLVQKFV